ncbi:pyridoxal-dependent decarboxylase [Flavobacterium sp. KACC 22763]|uniref:pyridoxal-dependent decarboxylase n=1 Tax=Flavobacterium sp. KACC 22763 TaxID=3025668 RepID=UPI002365DF9E|nr:pyridoxal-dependent decarboxylase [Flavobacterium sp. KACC 22763]WDF65959.1 pyridoxal-dependent decarboxylase [Flavobacterium sp. KACC 22763]
MKIVQPTNQFDNIALIETDRYLHNSYSNFEDLIQTIKLAQSYVNAKNILGPKHPVKKFQYNSELANEEIPFNGKCTEQVLEELTEIFEGSFRVQSKNSMFNLIPNPLIDTLASSILMQIHNNNAIMDSYGGKSILFEQKVSRCIGKLIAWDKACGISCNGGKVTMFYAIKFAIQRIEPKSPINGIPNDLVILISGGAHYSIEHTCSLLGLGKKNCIRIPIESNEGITSEKLKEVFEEQIKQGKRVAAIISCGGTTIDFIHDSTKTIYETTQKIVKEHKLDYTPYLHLDSVIGWLWFTFLKTEKDEITALSDSEEITQKISCVIRKLEKISQYDSIGVDFHKNGLCPYSSSFFIGKDDTIISNDKLSEKYYGELRAFDYTIENTRSSNGIASAWTSIHRLGLTGYQDYLISLYKSSKTISEALNNNCLFNLIDNNSCGWEILFTINFAALKDKMGIPYSYNAIAETFIQYIWNKVDEGYDIPNFSIVKNYGEWFGKKQNHAFIIYNMHRDVTPLTSKSIAELIAEQAMLFEIEIINGNLIPSSQTLATPIK